MKSFGGSHILLGWTSRWSQSAFSLGLVWGIGLGRTNWSIQAPGISFTGIEGLYRNYRAQHVGCPKIIRGRFAAGGPQKGAPA